MKNHKSKFITLLSASTFAGHLLTSTVAADTLNDLIRRDSPDAIQVSDRNGSALSADSMTSLNYIPASRVSGHKAVNLSLHPDIENILKQELQRSIQKYNAKSGFAYILDVRTGELIALADGQIAQEQSRSSSSHEVPFNRVSEGIYEFGQAAKIITTAMALDSGEYSLSTPLDLKNPVQIGKFSISDPVQKKRTMSVEEAFLQSSNIAAAQTVLKLGKEKQFTFLEALGLTKKLDVDLLVSSEPVVPSEWGTLNSVTISFGHGIAISPLQAGVAVAALVNGGVFHKPRLTPFTSKAVNETRVISKTTSANIRHLLRQDVIAGSGQKAAVAGVSVGGKSGTSEKVVNGAYDKDRLFTSFIGVFPIEDPQYLIMTGLDEPKASKDTYGFATAGWNAAPFAGNIIRSAAPALGVSLDIHKNDVPTTSSISKQ